MITIVKDDFTGLRTISSDFYGLNKFLSFKNAGDMLLRYGTDKIGGSSESGICDAFDLKYFETESGQGTIELRVWSLVGEYSSNSDWPHWNDDWKMIVDGERISLNSSISNSFKTDLELKIYDLPVDILNKLCTGKEIKFSLRGRNKTIEGILSAQHQTVFKAFEQYCFGEANEGKKLLESVGTIVSQNNQGSTPKQEGSVTLKLSDEENTKHENKVVDLLKNNKVDDAIKYYATNYEFTEENAKVKVKEIAYKNGLASVYTKYDNKQTLTGCLVLIVVGFIILLLFKAC